MNVGAYIQRLVSWQEMEGSLHEVKIKNREQQIK
jgi:hypothetical protein